MVKFLSGGSYTGTQVPVCVYWRTDLITDTDKDFATIRGQNHSGQCIANSFFKREDITCFNEGDCNGEGKCLPCSKYTHGGMKLGITHSPPIDIAKEFDKGLTDEQLQSPNLVKITSPALRRVARDQLPYHIVVRNIQAEIAKCCRWNASDGSADRFFLTPIIDGPDTKEIIDENGNEAFIKGITVQHPTFPDEVGSFFPVGTVVVAGFEGRPSFYLEPRTGLIKNGEGIIFRETAAGTVSTSAKSEAASSSQTVQDGVNATAVARNAALLELNRVTDFFNNVSSTNETETIAAAQVKLDTATDNFNAADTALTNAQALQTQANTEINAVLAAEDREDIEETAKTLADTLDALADEVEAAGAAAGSTTESEIAAAQTRLLRFKARQLRFSGFGAFSKCQFFFDDTNVAINWNAPEDGSLPCNGMRSDCEFYTGPIWKFATTEKMEVGKPITAEQIQEVRFHSDDWDRFTNPEEEFQNRFSVPFIWAFKDYVNTPFVPEVEDMLLYRPNVLFGRGTSESKFQTMRVEKVSISDFTDFDVEKSISRVQPGAETLDKDQPPDFPSIITEPLVPTNTRLNITHPRKQDEPFVYRTWDPDKNTITLFGTATPDVTVYIVNETALSNRQDYHTFLETRDIIEELPARLPGSPSFTNVIASELLQTLRKIENEKRVNLSDAPIGFDKVAADRTGFWNSINKVDLVHNAINQLFVFAISGESVLVDSIKVDYRFLHSIIQQTEFTGVDFPIQDTIGSTKLGAVATSTEQTATIKANPHQLVGSELVTFNQGYYGARFRDRNLQLGTINAASDLIGGTSITDESATFVVSESDASAFVVNVGYQVVRYRKSIEITDWYLVDDCGFIMLKIDDLDVHRVLPLPDTSGAVRPLPNVLVNNGATGSETAQWALESVTLTIDSEEKVLVQFYRDPDGVGLPANYVVVGPSDAAEELFGRPDLETSTIQATITFLRAQTIGEGNNTSEAELNEEVVDLNFYNDSLKSKQHSISFDSSGLLTAGGARTEAIEPIQRDIQEYVWVFQDSEGRPIGRKYSRLMVMYHNIAAINTEVFYQWTGSCTTYALSPDLFLDVGRNDGTLTNPLKATVDPDELLLGFRIANLLGTRDCISNPSCGDHEHLQLGKLRSEFELISFGQTDSETGLEQFPGGKAFFPSAGQAVPPGNNIVERPGSQFLVRKGAMWYPYTLCEKPRYAFRTNGPLGTDSTELINDETASPGISEAFISSSQVNTAANAGIFGSLKPIEDEAYRGADRVVPKILDIHPSLRLCTSAYTYGNQVLTGGESLFTGYARRRGEIDQFWYDFFGWAIPPFGNSGRPRLIFEVSEKVGDYLGGLGNGTKGFRWMPMFPEREDLGATISLFTEDIEPQHYRLLAQNTPAGPLGETVSVSSVRYDHKALVVNKTAASIEYPFAPYFPMFIPDASIGLSPEQRGTAIEEGSQIGTISTMWAWREQEKPIRRGELNSVPLAGLQLQSPDYAIDHRRLEVRLRPSAGDYKLKFTPPTYELNGDIINNAKLSLGEGPVREIAIDFKNRRLDILRTGIYDTSKELEEGGDPSTSIPCEPDTATDNALLSNLCSCIQDITDPTLTGTTPGKLPARFQHLDELAPDPGFFALYESEEINTPFAVDIPRATELEPCCLCIYYIRGIFAKFDLDFLPTTANIDPTFSTGVDLKYTWSRVPHGYPLFGAGRDGIFDATENRAENYIEDDNGGVFIQRFIPGNREADPQADEVNAFFPSRTFATQAASLGFPIVVDELAPGDPKLKGGAPANLNGDLGTSQGQGETIVLDMLFDTFVKVNRVTVGFVAGRATDLFDIEGLDVSYGVPLFSLSIVDSENRTGNSPTTRIRRTIGTSIRTSSGLNIPDLSGTESSTLAKDGKLLFQETITPDYTDQPFWNKFGQEFHLIFGSRGNDSMGIAFVELEIETMITTGDAFEEDIFITERKYYTSNATPVAGNNPEQFLSEVDSASAYWRTTQETSLQGANRFRAYAWGEKITDDQDPLRGDVRELEALQEEEYNKARNLLASPYRFTYNSFIPFDEKEYLEFLGVTLPQWSLNMSMTISDIDEVQTTGGKLIYGELPERIEWNAPGHAWTYDFEEQYTSCCDACPREQLINYQFAHLHDGLAVVETARFWDELPSGFTRLQRSTMFSPDPTFQGGSAGGADGDTVLLDAALFTDANGNPIDVSILENAGFRRDDDGTLVILDNKGV